MPNVRDTAVALGVSRSAVRKAIARGTLPASRGPGPHQDFDVDDAAIDAYRRQHRRPIDHAGVTAYRAVAALMNANVAVDAIPVELSGPARAYAQRRRRRWPPRTEVTP